MQDQLERQNEQIVLLCKLISEFEDTMREQNKKINKMMNTIQTLEDRLREKTEREVNKALRLYSLGKGQPIDFVPTKVSLSKMFE